MVLVGYERDTDTGETVWILKNSWGTSWGENGYGYLKVSLNDIYLTYNLHSPVVSRITSYEIACRDADGDGYYNWGLSEEPPPSCKNVPSVRDCDDSDSNVALLKDDGSCVAAVLDKDKDGVPDTEDKCLDSDLSATVIIDKCDSGVTNQLFSNGCTISDRITACAKSARNHGRFVSCVSQFTNNLMKTEVITGKGKGAIQNCAAKANIP